MPSRTREHELETISRNRLRASLPARWLFRDLNDDYGIDGQIEVFSPNGDSTGLLFLVQLKATDESDLTTALRMRIAKDKYEYFQSIDLPVLMVRYHCPSDQLFGRWVHSFDRNLESTAKKSISFKLHETRRLTSARFEQLETDVVTIQQIRNNQLQRPINISLSVEEPPIPEASAAETLIAIQAAAKPVRSIIAVTAKSEKPNSLLFRVNRSGIFVTLADRPGCNFQFEGPYPGTLDELSRDAITAVALAIDSVGFSKEAATCLTYFLRESRFCRSLVTALEVSACLCRGKQREAAMGFIEDLLEDEDSYAIAQSMLLPFLTEPTQSDADKRRLVELLERLAERLEAKSWMSQAAAMIYNAGNVLRSADQINRAIGFYRRAASLDSNYCDRRYFCSELAGMFFTVKRYHVSAQLYRRALELGDHDVAISARLADAEFFCGEFSTALYRWEKDTNNFDEDECIGWDLRAGAARYLISVTGKDSQTRKRRASKDQYSTGDMLDAEIEKIELAALSNDALDQLAWFNLGGVRFRREEYEDAASCYLLAVVIHPFDETAWFNALLAAGNSKDEDLQKAIILYAQQLLGQRFLGVLAKGFGSVPPDKAPEDADALLLQASQVLDEIASGNTETELPVLRVHTSPHEFKEFGARKKR